MAWKQIGSWGTHQERKERRRHRRGNDEREAVEVELAAVNPFLACPMCGAADDQPCPRTVSKVCDWKPEPTFYYDPDEHYAPIKLVPVDDDSFEAW